MKTLIRILLSLVLLILIVGIIAYADGTTLPVDHTTTVTGIVAAPPTKVFDLITEIANGATWRREVKSVKLLPPVSGPNGSEDHWIEDLGHGQTMTFLAVRTDDLTPQGHARRQVLLDVPGAAYGGTWTYEISPGPAPVQTTLSITEAGYIHPPIYRFMMTHVLGMTYNLNQYMSDIQAAALRP